MKPNKKLALAALLGAALFANTTVAVHAQASTNAPLSTLPVPSHPPRMRGPNIDYLAKQLSLTDDQKVKFTAALDEMQQKMRALRTDQSLSQEDRRSQLKQLREDLNTELKGVLTDDQFAKWENFSNRHRPAVHPPAGTVPSTNSPAAAN
jgi:Spy/CpxP family protein refolding chaperone